MDELYQKRSRKAHSRVASVSEKNSGILSSGHSPQLYNNFSSFLQSSDHRKASEHPFALNSSLSSQNKSVKMNKKLAPSPQNSTTFHLDQFSSKVEKGKVGALSLRIETPTSGRKSYSSVEKSMARTQSRTRKDSKEIIDKIVNSSQFNHVNRRASSNPRVSPNASGYSSSKTSGKTSFDKAKKLYFGKDLQEEDAKISYLKQAWMPLNAPATSGARPGLARQPLRLVDKKDQNSFRDKKASYKHNQQAAESNFLSNFSQLEKSYIKLKNSSHCLEVEEPKPGANLGRDLQKLGFRLKQEIQPKNAPVENEKIIQKPQEPPQMVKVLNFEKEAVDSKISKASKVTKLEDKDTIFNVRPLDTEEVYEDFFDTSKMQFGFEKTRVSIRSEKYKDKYTSEPKRRPSINRVSNSKGSEKEMSLSLSSSKPFEDKSLQVKNFG